MSVVLRQVRYRLGQGWRHLGFVRPLSMEDYREVQSHLPASALTLFAAMSRADQQHCLRVCRGLQARGCEDQEMLAAALLHDVGKACGRVPFWTRPVIVLAKWLVPGLLHRALLPLSDLGTNKATLWRRVLSYAWWHAEVGADAAYAAGLSARAVLYIRTHHQVDGPAAELYKVDEIS
jgi:hypothetical protein